MAKITKYAMKLPVFQQIVKNVSYDVPKNKTHKEYTIFNDCELIPTATYNQYAYEYATGVKSGATEASGYCVSATAQKDGINYVCVVMGGKKTDIDGKTYTSALIDARRLFRWAYNNFKMKAVSTESTIIAEVPVRFSPETDHVSLVPEKTITSLVPKNVDESTLIIEPIDLPQSINAPIEKGTFVCKAKVIHAEEEIMQINLVAYTDVHSSFFMRIFSFFSDILKSPIVLIILIIALAAAAVFVYRYIHKKKRLKRQKARIAVAQKSEEPRNNDYRDKFSSFKDDLD